MSFINCLKATIYMHTPCSKYISQSFGRIHDLKCDYTPDTIPLIFIKPLNAIIVPYGGNKIEIIVYSCIRILNKTDDDNLMMTYCRFHTWRIIEKCLLKKNCECEKMKIM